MPVCVSKVQVGGEGERRGSDELNAVKCFFKRKELGNKKNAGSTSGLYFNSSIMHGSNMCVMFYIIFLTWL